MIRAIYRRWLKNGFGLKSCVGSRVQNETSEKDRRTHRPERCEYNDEDTSPNTFNVYCVWYE